MLSISRSGRRDQCMGRQQFSALLQKREQAWDEAEAESDRIGNPYKNRHGVMVQRPATDMVGVVLKRYCEEAGLRYQ